jgi:hypothetical protein
MFLAPAITRFDYWSTSAMVMFSSLIGVALHRTSTFLRNN